MQVLKEQMQLWTVSIQTQNKSEKKRKSVASPTGRGAAPQGSKPEFTSDAAIACGAQDVRPSVITIKDTLAWMPPTLRRVLLAKGTHMFRFSTPERVVMRRQKYLKPSLWAEKRRVVRMSSLPGRWQNLFTPYLVGLMDAARFPGVQTVILCKTPQTGGSEAGLNILGQMIEMSPGPAMIVFPDELTAKENSKDRILPMIQDSPRLRNYMSGSMDDASSIRINLKHMPIYLGWSGSVSRLGNKPIRILILDELDKYQNLKKEATSESLAEKRTTTWKTRRFIFKLSTPTTEDGPIWWAFTNEAHARFDYHVLCPHCGAAQQMIFDNIKWPEGESEPEKVSSDRLAWYECAHCKTGWSDADRDMAARKGFWVERVSGLELFAHLHQHGPIKLGFHLPSWYSYFVSLSEVAASYLKYQKSGRIEDLKEFRNQYCAEPWVQEFALRSEDEVLALCDDRPRGAIPGHVDGKVRVASLLAAVDTQGINEEKGYFRYTIRAFGFGDVEESWLVQAGSVTSFSALNDVLWNSVYKDAQGNEYKVRACMIDAMGRRTKEVYTWAIRHRGRVFPWQGVRSLSQPYTPSAQEYFPDAKGNKIKIPGGLFLYRCDTTFFKSDLANKLSIAPDDPGAFHLHTNQGGILEQYAREMCVEVWDEEKMAWENPNRKANHYWDCEVMCLALAFILNIRHKKEPDGVNSKKKKRINQVRKSQSAMSVAEQLSRLRR